MGAAWKCSDKDCEREANVLYKVVIQCEMSDIDRYIKENPQCDSFQHITDSRDLMLPWKHSLPESVTVGFKHVCLDHIISPDHMSCFMVGQISVHISMTGFHHK